jgi:hypothetical protein
MEWLDSISKYLYGSKAENTAADEVLGHYNDNKKFYSGGANANEILDYYNRRQTELGSTEATKGLIGEGGKFTLFGDNTTDSKIKPLTGFDKARVTLGVASLAGSLYNDKFNRGMARKELTLDKEKFALDKAKFGYNSETGTTTKQRVALGLGKAFT